MGIFKFDPWEKKSGHSWYIKTEDVKLANWLVKFVQNIFLNIKERSKEIWFPFHYKHSLQFFPILWNVTLIKIIFLIKLTFVPKIVIFKCASKVFGVSKFKSKLANLFAAKKWKFKLFSLKSKNKDIDTNFIKSTQSLPQFLAFLFLPTLKHILRVCICCHHLKYKANYPMKEK